jgi:hypothetical protein
MAFNLARNRKKGLMDEEIAVIVREVTGSLAQTAVD